jgi:hypothetical protein
MKKYFSGALDVLEELVSKEDGKPILAGGAPFQLMDLVEHGYVQGRDISLPHGSAVMLGGGWKHIEKGDIDERKVVEQIKGFFGKDVSVFDTYGMAEGGFTALKQCKGSTSEHFDCTYANSHLPHSLDAFVMLDDGEITQKSGSHGRFGYSLPIMNRISTIVTDDEITLDAKCGCGFNGHVIRDKIVRASDAVPRGCGLSPEDSA